MLSLLEVTLLFVLSVKTSRQSLWLRAFFLKLGCEKYVEDKECHQEAWQFITKGDKDLSPKAQGAPTTGSTDGSCQHEAELPLG